MLEKNTQPLQNNVNSTELGMVVTAPIPLPNQTLKYRKLYLICFICMIIGIIFTPLLGVGFLGLLISYLINNCLVDIKRKKLRSAKFKFIGGVDDENLLATMHPIFAGKYNMLVERSNEGVMTISHDKHIYDILIQEDATFTIWWRMSIGNAFFRFNEYKSYCRILSSMGIIAYEIQNAYHIQ